MTEPVRYAYYPVTSTEINLEHLHFCSPASSIQSKSKSIVSVTTTMKNSHPAHEVREKTIYNNKHLKNMSVKLVKMVILHAGNR